MKTLQEQYAFLNFFADGTHFVLDTQRSPKAEFARLAQMKGWVGGDTNWQAHWQVCFGEMYRYGSRRVSITTTDPEGTPASDLVDRMRRLSTGSDISESFSIVSSAPSVRSLESAAGGVAVNHESEGSKTTPHADTTTLPTRTRAAQPIAKAAAPGSAAAKARPISSSPPVPESKPACSPFWFQFPGFTPTPTATFNQEFSRLAKHQAWDKATLQLQKVTALMSEVNFYYGTCMNRLESWQQLCEEVGIEKPPTSTTQCRKALKTVYINLYNIIDHRRNPASKVTVFKSYAEFAKYTRNKRTFPRACAKQGGFINVLLRKM